MVSMFDRAAHGMAVLAGRACFGWAAHELAAFAAAAAGHTGQGCSEAVLVGKGGCASPAPGLATRHTVLDEMWRTDLHRSAQMDTEGSKAHISGMPGRG